jgi:acyl-CoA reductase-like NAD-dependent aldehyde dehydrogenase
VYALGSRHGKRVQAAGGAKNVLLVMPDAEPEPTLRAILGSSFGCAGQRCMAGSVLMGVGKAVFVDKLPLNCVCVGGNGTVPLGVTCGRRSLASG